MVSFLNFFWHATTKWACEEEASPLLNVARALSFQVNLPISFWGECVLAATHIINRTLVVANKGVTPYEMLYGKPASYDHLRVFWVPALCEELLQVKRQV